ncbi:phosphoprotein [Vesiculovirus perinet]|uniref:Phosphoprotein n=1 Tax=Vesiculovirus perinet TaxID=1972569 RepID=I1SV88_9RHAB|nr:phosphoprotein [Vesiculovirus perinet]AEG25352.1 phosphoprotein [Vesiculovirus perinet]
MSRLLETFKNYPNLEKTMEEINDIEDSTSQEEKKVTLVLSEEPSYFLAHMLPSEEDETDEEGGGQVDVNPYEDAESSDLNEDEFEVNFDKKPWTALTEKVVKGNIRIDMMHPEGLTDAQFTQWVQGIQALLDISHHVDLNRLKLGQTSDGIVLIEEKPKRPSSPSLKLELKEFVSPDSRFGTPTDNSSESSLGLPPTPEKVNWKQTVEIILEVKALDPDLPSYKTTLSKLFGSQEAALQYCNSGSPMLKDAFIAGLKRKGIFNRMRTKYILDPTLPM